MFSIRSEGHFGNLGEENKLKETTRGSDGRLGGHRSSSESHRVGFSRSLWAGGDRRIAAGGAPRYGGPLTGKK